MKTHPKILAALAGRWLDRPGEPRGDEAIEAFARALVAYAEDETLQRLAGPEANEILEQADVEAEMNWKRTWMPSTSARAAIQQARATALDTHITPVYACQRLTAR